MLTKEFSRVWFIGEVDEQAVKKLKEELFKALSRGRRRIMFRFYVSNPEDNSYLDAIKPVLIENTALSVVVEGRSITKLHRDLADLSGEEEVEIIVGSRLPNLPELTEAVNLKVGEARGDA